MNPILLGTSNFDDDFSGSERSPEPPHTPSPIMEFFKYEHLPPKLQEASWPFCELAKHLDRSLPNGAEKSVSLRKLLESKDAGVRAALSK